MADTPGSANRTLALLSTKFSFAHRPLEWVEKNPSEGVVRNKEKKRKRYMKESEAEKRARDLMLHGPQFKGEGVSQDDIDALF